jgi:hypothetical protein
MIDYSQILTLNYINFQWILNGDSYDGLVWLSDTPKPAQEELDALWPSTQDEFAKQSCKQKAKELLYETDWSTIPDVSNPDVSNPYLVNQSEFAAYRSIIRGYAVNPVVDPVWPTPPTEQWSS